MAVIKMNHYLFYNKKILFLTWIFLLCQFLGCHTDTSIPEGIYASPAVCDLGVVIDKEEITGDFKIINMNKKSVNIRSTKLSCGCSNLVLSNEVIPTGGNVDVKITTTLQGRYGPNLFDALIFTDDPANPVIQLQLRANIAKKKLDGTVMLNLGLLAPCEKINQSFSILPGAIHSITVKNVQYDFTLPRESAIKISAVVVDSEGVKLKVEGGAPAQNGEFSINADLKAEGADWNEAKVILQGRVHPEISIPTTITLGFVEPNKTTIKKIDFITLPDFFSKNSIDKIVIVNDIPKILDIKLVNSPHQQL
ncbi:MAG: DUF1573 domain-containing protein, partial [Planctomycetaceae bacterium]|nr:DUF1573 domain-containing protein [Planctomycetaceae bacterium]